MTNGVSRNMMQYASFVHMAAYDTDEGDTILLLEPCNDPNCISGISMKEDKFLYHIKSQEPLSLLEHQSESTYVGSTIVIRYGLGFIVYNVKTGEHIATLTDSNNYSLLHPPICIPNDSYWYITCTKTCCTVHYFSLLHRKTYELFSLSPECSRSQLMLDTQDTSHICVLIKSECPETKPKIHVLCTGA